MLALKTYYRSSAAYRVRIALALKDIEHDLVPINLLKQEHQGEQFLSSNPDGLVPCLQVDDSHLGQSMAILEYLEEVYPEPSLFPAHALDRAYVRGLAQTIASDIHPLNNLRVLKFLKNDLSVSENEKLNWYHHWLAQGFNSLEQRLSNDERTGNCCFGDLPGLADVCLVPQVYNAIRFEFDISAYPTIERINAHCLELEAFQASHPDRQPDTPS